MDTQTFLRSVLGTDGHYCVLAIKNGKRVQKFYPTIEALQNAAENFDENGYDAYYGLGTFEEADSREAENVKQMHAFYMDLDCGVHLEKGTPKDFPDQLTAIKALKAFCKTNRLPRPTLVNSGYGVHVYWPLSGPVNFMAWLPVAEKLKALAKAQGFKADASVTADAARVLRVPGTHNHKGGNRVPVSIFGLEPPQPVDFFAFAGLFEGVAMPVLFNKYVPSGGNNAMMDALIGKREALFKTILAKTAAGKGCAQIAYIIENRAKMDEPMWRAGLSIAKFCSDGGKAAKVISQEHPDYSEHDTMMKMDRIKGPYLCSRFEDYNPGGCRGCVHLNKLKSPITLGMQFKEADPQDNVVLDPVATVTAETTTEDDTPAVVSKPYVIPAYPKPYFRGQNGGVFIRIVDDEGEVAEHMVWQNDLYVTRRLEDPEMGEVLEMRHHLPRDKVKTFVVPMYVATSKDEYRKVLSANSVGALGKEIDAIMIYTQAWVKELQYTTQADDAHRQFGWVGDFDGFVLGDKVFYGDRVEHNAPSSATRGLLEFFEPKGTMAGWKEAMGFYNKPGFELHQFVVCAGFGSVLMKFMPVHAALIHLWSKDSGFGKTTVQQAALSIWGDPGRTLLGENDTYNSKMNRADVMHSLPVCMDEITNIKPTDGSDLIYQVTGGRQRNRMSSTSNAERYRGDPWNLLFITSANCSLIDKVSIAKAMPKAEAQRVLEIETSKLFTEKADKELTDKFSRALLVNYGHAGPPFVQYIMQNRDAVQLLVETIQMKIDKAANLGPENRFWSASAAAIIAAAVICNHLKLLPYDVPALQKYVVTKVLGTNQASSVEMSMDPMALISDYTYQNWGRILQIKSTMDRRGQKTTENGIDELVVPDQSPRSTDLVGRYETDLKCLYLLPRPFKEWLSERQVNYLSVLNDLKTRGTGKKAKIRLTKGTKMNLPAVDVLEVSIDLEPANGLSDQ